MRSESVECVMFVPDTPENRAAFMGKELLLAEIYKLSNIKIVFKDILGLNRWIRSPTEVQSRQRTDNRVPILGETVGYLSVA